MKKQNFIFICLTTLLCGCNTNQVSSITSSQSSSSLTESSSSSIVSEESSVEEDPNNIDIIILAGQSNAEGHTHIKELMKNIDEDQYKLYNSGFTKTKIKYNCNNGTNRSTSFVDVKLGQGFDVTRFGPEIGMAETFEKAELKRDLYVFKYALGATNLYQQWRSYSSGSEGQLFTKFSVSLLETIAELEDEGYIPHVKGICWMQGEADSCDTLFTTNYEEYEKNFFADISELVGEYLDDETLHIFDAYISNYSGWKNYKFINLAKKNNSENNPNHHVIDTIEEGLEYDKEPLGSVDYYHYDSLSMIKLGNLFASSILEYAL